MRVRSEVRGPCGRPIGLSRTPGDAVTPTGPSECVSAAEISHCFGPVGVTASPGVRERPIGLPHGLSLHFGLSNLRTLKSVRPWESEHGLSPQSHVICLRVRSERPCSASHGLTDLRRPICEAVRVRSAIGLRARQCV